MQFLYKAVESKCWGNYIIDRFSLPNGPFTSEGKYILTQEFLSGIWIFCPWKEPETFVSSKSNKKRCCLTKNVVNHYSMVEMKKLLDRSYSLINIYVCKCNSQ